MLTAAWKSDEIPCVFVPHFQKYSFQSLTHLKNLDFQFSEKNFKKNSAEFLQRHKFIENYLY